MGINSNTWSTIRLVLILGLAGFLYAFSSLRNGRRSLQKTEVVFIGESNSFMRQETVNKLLIENKSDLRSITKEQLNLDKLESSVNKNPMVEKSEVYVSVDGVLRAEVVQRTPVARVMVGETSYYLDKNGKQMPLSNHYTARVPLLTGSITDDVMPKLTAVMAMMQKDPFLKKNIISVRVLNDKSLEMASRNHPFVIEFGQLVNPERKFLNYKAFFQKAVKDSTLEKYKRINLRFIHQVVCTR